MDRAINLIKEFEGYRENAYLDGLGVPTIGYGTTHWFNGKPVKLGEKVTKEEAERLLQSFVTEAIVPHLREIPGWGEMSPNQRGALISFAYNLGPGFMRASDGFDTIQRYLNGQEWDKVGGALELYSMPGTNVHAGLLRRRKAERALWEA